MVPYVADLLVVNYILETLPLNKKSTITNAAIASTMGTARGTTQGSCLPLPETVVSFPCLSILFWSFIIVATGLKATLK